MFSQALPKMSATFKPRAEAGLLSQLVQNAWREYSASLENEAERLQVAEIVAQHIEARIPAADLPVLHKYHCVSEADTASVRIYNAQTSRWDETAHIKLPRKVWALGDGYPEAHACDPRWSRDPHRGCKPEWWNNRATEDEKRRVIEHQDASERGALPESVDSYFAKIVEARRAYKAEYRQSTDFPAEFKAEQGRWPTWQEIADRFPVLAAHIARLHKQAADAAKTETRNAA